jgi:hypothetical protein
MEPICAQTSLEVLHLGDAPFMTDAAAVQIAACLPRLRSLRITHCAGVMDEGARALAALTALEDLDLTSPWVSWLPSPCSFLPDLLKDPLHPPCRADQLQRKQLARSHACESAARRAPC